MDDEVIGLVHEDARLVGVSTESGAIIPCDAAWTATRLKAASQLAASLCDVDEAGFAKTDENGRTSRPGVFAVGNATNPIAHLAHAAAYFLRLIDALKERKWAQSAHLLDLFAEDDRLNVYAGELEVRPPGAPTIVNG